MSLLPWNPGFLVTFLYFSTGISTSYGGFVSLTKFKLSIHLLRVFNINISHNYGLTCQSFFPFSHLSIFNNGAVIELSVDTASFLRLRQNSSY